MKEPSMKIRRLFMALLLACLWGTASAQYPPGDRPIRFFVPFPPGSGTDTATRLLAEALAVSLKRPVLVENRPGANATIASTIVVKSAPDGFTLIMVGGSVTNATYLIRNLNYDPLNDLAPIYYFASSPLALYVAADSPAKSFPMFVELAKTQAGKLSYGSNSVNARVAMAEVMNSMNIELIHVPYKGVPQALNDIAGGVLTTTFADIGTGASFTAAGKIRPLALMKRTRSPRAPDLPTLYEFGYQGHEVINWTGVFAPAKTPPELVQYLAREIRAIAARPDFKERFERVGLDLNQGGTPEAFSAYLRQEYEVMGRVIKRLGIEPE